MTGTVREANRADAIAHLWNVDNYEYPELEWKTYPEQKVQAKYTSANFDRLSPTEKELNNKAFATNIKDPFYHDLTSLTYRDGETERELNVPKGDVFFQFREASIGLGYRVPMIMASPWTRGGFVNSEIFDHTSSLQFPENFLEKKFSKRIKEDNITQWRRTICGDLTSVFRPYLGEKINSPEFLEKKPFIAGIHQAQFRQAPANFKKLSAAEIAQINTHPEQSPYFPQQEKGTRPACALPYELYTHRQFNEDRQRFDLVFKAGNKVFGKKAAGSPFRVYAINPYQQEILRAWDYSVAAGDQLQDEWTVADFENGVYHLRVYGPNGFYRVFAGNRDCPLVKIECDYERNQPGGAKLTGHLLVQLTNNDARPHQFIIADNSYKTGGRQKKLGAGEKASILPNLSKTAGWYDFSVKMDGFGGFEERFAGHVENGAVSKTDPILLSGLFTPVAETLMTKHFGAGKAKSNILRPIKNQSLMGLLCLRRFFNLFLTRRKIHLSDIKRHIL